MSKPDNDDEYLPLNVVIEHLDTLFDRLHHATSSVEKSSIIDEIKQSLKTEIELRDQRIIELRALNDRYEKLLIKIASVTHEIDDSLNMSSNTDFRPLSDNSDHGGGRPALSEADLLARAGMMGPENLNLRKYARRKLRTLYGYTEEQLNRLRND